MLDRDGTILIAGDGVGRLTGWDMTSDRPKPFAGPTDHLQGIVDVAFLPEGKTFVARDRSKRAILWDASGRTLRKIQDLSNEPLSLMASANRPEPGGIVLAAAVEPREGGPGKLLGFDAAAKLVARLDGPGGRISSLDLSDDGRRLVAGDDDGRVVIIDLPSKAVAWQGQFEGTIQLANVSKDGMLLISDAKLTRLVQPRIGGVSVALVDASRQSVPGEVERSSFSSDGKWLAACTSDGRPCSGG